MNRLDKKIAVITGATQGLGEAIAWRFAESGAAGLVICGRNETGGRRVATAITERFGIEVSYIAADLAHLADCRAVIAAADREFGRLDILVNAAAVTDRGTIIDTPEALFDRIMAVNVRAPFFLLQDAVKIMLREKIAGSVVNIGSVSAHAGQPFIAAYCVSKGGLATLTRNSAYALMRNRIRVNQLNPGWMATPGEDRIQRVYHQGGDDWLARAAAQQPFGRLIDPAEIARAACFMASDESGMMTGAVVNFDQSVWGGYSSSPPTPDSGLTLAETEDA